MITFFAATRLGAVQVPVNTAYKGEYLRHQLAAWAGAALEDERIRAQPFDAFGRGGTITLILAGAAFLGTVEGALKNGEAVTFTGFGKFSPAIKLSHGR